LSVAKFVHSFYNGRLPNHFDKYFTEIASVQKYQTKLACLEKYYLYTLWNENVSGSALFKVYWSQNLV